MGPGRHPGGFAAMVVVGPALHEARKDGVVTRAAFDAAVKARFEKLDTDHDGKLTHEELRAGFGGWGRGGWGHGDHGRGRWEHHHHDDGDHGPHPDGDTPPPAGTH